MNWMFFILGCAFIGVNPGLGAIFLAIGLMWPNDDDEGDDD